MPGGARPILAVARALPSAVGAPAGLSMEAGLTRLGLSLPNDGPDERRLLVWLLMPFLIVAAALAANNGLRRTQALLPEIVERVPLRPGPKVALVAPEPAAVRPIAVPVALPALPERLGPPETARAGLADDAVKTDRMAVVLPPSGLKWPPGSPAITDPDQPDSVCRSEASAQLASWSPRTSRATLGGVPAGVDDGAYGLLLAQAARAQTQDLVIYSARYQSIAYPLGDLHAMYGACTDVVIRAYRALGVDLQQLVQRAQAGSGDRNIDHRRTETLRRFFTRAGASLPVSGFPEDYKPGDIVTYHRPFSRVSSSHIAIVSDVLAPTGRPMIVHNRGWGPQLEDALFVDRITGHYRYIGPTTPEAAVVPASTVAARGVSRLSRAAFARSIAPRPAN